MLFLISYSVGMIFYGNLGDTIDLRKYIAFGCIPAASCLILISLLGSVGIVNKFLLIILMMMNGFF
jgi:hypothetical protein